MQHLNIADKAAALIAIPVIFLLSSCTPPAAVKISNRAPVIENVLYPKDIFANMEVQVQCVAADADSDNLTYQWISEAGKIMGEGNVVQWFPPEKLGTYPISVVVTDGNGGEARQTFNIRVVTNADGTSTPTIDVKMKLGDEQTVIVDKQRARIWTTTDIVCQVENNGGKPLTYTWSTSGGKMVGPGLEDGKAGKIGWVAPGVKGDFIIEVTVSDSEGKKAKGQVNMEVFCCGN